ncbi:hypothetical protein A3D14_00485 [Candidatus Saccharibacteria bacterium RIFCSPHIGHO2_02_FULL_47_12]|nr:MAG: hypothetical protein A3D14_00485 [Candidatus Saccharibacteria bacterium RIFCSPHIGHO2_02_FULL_47_12]
MSLEKLHDYELARQQVVDELEVRLPADQPGLLYGSVARAFGPFSDIDLITFGKDYVVKGLVQNTRVQEHLFSAGDFYDYVVNSPRGLHSAIDGVIIHEQSGLAGDVIATHQRQRLHVRDEGSADFVALMQAEQDGDTNRPDIRANRSHYALKRSFGGKRSVTRSFLSTLVMHSDVFDLQLPSEKMEALLDKGLIDEGQLDSIFAVNALLIAVYNSQTIPRSEWDSHTKQTAEWCQQVGEWSEDYLSEALEPGYISLLSDASSTSAESQRRALSYAAADTTNQTRSRTVLWRLVANDQVDPDVLFQAWTLCEKQPRVLRELGCAAVQLPQFKTLDIDPASPLLNDPDVQFSTFYKA